MKQSRIAPLQGNSGSLAAWYQVADDEHLVAQALNCQRMTVARSNHLTCPSALYLNAEVKTSGIQPKTQLIGYAGLQVLQELSSKEGCSNIFLTKTMQKKIYSSQAVSVVQRKTFQVLGISFLSHFHTMTIQFFFPDHLNNHLVNDKQLTASL